MNLSTYAAMARTAVREPEKIPPFVRSRARRLVEQPRRRLATRRRTQGLLAQRRLLDEVRATDEWLVIVLDACRFDALQAVWSDWFHGHLHPACSAGRDTFEYVRLCWPDEYDVAYCSGATPINSHQISYDLDGFNDLYDGYQPREHISEIVDVWATGWDESLGTCPPWSVTDAALERRDASHLVAHYFQPHAPYIGDDQLLGNTGGPDARPFEGNPVDEPIWSRVRYGDVSDAELRAAYRSNLEVALREVARLIDQVDHDLVAILGDHGEALGEYGVYSHPRLEHPHIRRVPFGRVTGLTNYAREQITDAERGRDQSTPAGVEERLTELGYL